MNSKKRAPSPPPAPKKRPREEADEDYVDRVGVWKAIEKSVPLPPELRKEVFLKTIYNVKPRRLFF